LDHHLPWRTSAQRERHVIMHIPANKASRSDSKKPLIPLAGVPVIPI
jgi:hypothetical protein